MYQFEKAEVTILRDEYGYSIFKLTTCSVNIDQTNISIMGRNEAGQFVLIYPGSHGCKITDLSKK